jgi:hypothetical protein
MFGRSAAGLGVVSVSKQQMIKRIRCAAILKTNLFQVSWQPRFVHKRGFLLIEEVMM